MKIGIVGFGRIGSGLVKLCQKKKVKYVVFQKGDGFKGLSSCDLVIEAITEEFRKKISLYKTIISYLKKDTPIATTTSSLSINNLAVASGVPERFVGLHFFNPPHHIEFVEVIPAKKIAFNFLKKATDFIRLINYDYVILPDTKGFVANWILFNMLLGAVELRVRNKINEDIIDSVVKKSLKHPMGPFELINLIGMDTADRIFGNLFSGKKLAVWKEYYETYNR